MQYKKLMSFFILLITSLMSPFIPVVPVVAQECLVPDLVSGGPPPDGVPAVDNPEFYTIEEFENNYGTYNLDYGNILVIGVVISGEARAYPFDILNYHEIVNDEFNGESYSITYCPLTGSGLVFHTESIRWENDPRPGELGTSGKLFENNLVFYDRLTGSCWSQMFNIGLNGDKVGKSLEKIHSVETTWNTWKAMHPNTVVLDRKSGSYHDSRYNQITPYFGYSTSTSIYFPTGYDSTQEPYNLFHPKTTTLVVRINREPFLYPFPELAVQPVLNQVIKNQSVVIVYDEANRVAVPFSATLNNGTTLTFSLANSTDLPQEDTGGLMVYQDQTGTIWNMRGEAKKGPLQGEQLIPIAPSYNAYWFAATAFFPYATIFSNNSMTQSTSSPIVSIPLSFTPIISIFALIIATIVILRMRTKRKNNK